MKRIFFGLVVIFTMVCFFTLIPSTAADKVEFIGDESHGIDDDIRAQNAPRASGQNYSKENYTAEPPSPGEDYNHSATRIFSTGESVRLINRYYAATPGNFNRYHFITDVVGTVLATFTQGFSISTAGNYFGSLAVVFNATGNYVYQSLTLGPGQWISSQQFSFSVE